ncbi:DUF1629 domain-containing protein [uncultured Mameliella sp.]|uniref:imm11 family protein n=1 Tax=uncultured Mameliella sp. TaxID=1447087 RepID=UPI00261629BB|nr:DUF1629 domain-containing protein [uncultured Mameliella sp.]
MRYYLLNDDKHFPDRWFLGAIEHADNWRFLKPEMQDMEPGRYTLHLQREGTPMDYTQTLLYGLPVLSEKARNSLRGIPEVDEPFKNVVMEPVDINGGPWATLYYLMIVETRFDCVDEVRSEFRKFEENDPVRPDKAGEYAIFTNFVIDPDKTEGRHIFRVSTYQSALIVSEEVKRRFEEEQVSGCNFISVMGDREVVV